jgi:hypothetical protein
MGGPAIDRDGDDGATEAALRVDLDAVDPQLARDESAAPQQRLGVERLAEHLLTGADRLQRRARLQPQMDQQRIAHVLERVDVRVAARDRRVDVAPARPLADAVAVDADQPSGLVGQVCGS